MTNSATAYYNFDTEFEEFEKNRMYPPNHERSLSMVKLKHAHILSLNTARLFLHKAFDKTHEPRFKREIEADVTRLDELKAILMHALANPELPFGSTEDPNGSEDAGRTD